MLLHSRSRVRTEREERKIEGDLRRSQRACEQLDSQKVRLIIAIAQAHKCTNVLMLHQVAFMLHHYSNSTGRFSVRESFA